MKKRKSFIKNDIKCQNCANWDLMSASPLLSYEPPKVYLVEILHNKQMRSMEVTFKFLNFAINTVTRKLMAGDWSEKSVIVYCSATGTNVASCEELIPRTKISRH